MSEHLHRDDCPKTLQILYVLFEHRLDAASEIGFTPTRCGALVDWDGLVRSWLSSTEKAAVHIAHGCAIGESHGGLGPGLRWVVADAITAVCR